MAPDDRDRIFDKALSRHLRSTAPSQESACLDAESLAAYHERSLLPQEMNSAKEHIVGCAHCQAILAQLELTETIPLAAVEKEPLAAVAARAAAAPEQRAIAAKAAPPAKAASPRTIRGPRWYWLVPVGALAAGLLVWVGVHQNQAQHLSALREDKMMAKVQEPTAPLPSLNKPALSAPKAIQLDALSKSKGAVGGALKGPTSPTENLRLSRRADLADTHTPTAVAPSVKQSESAKDGARDASASLIAAESRAELDAKTVPAGALREQIEQQNQAANIQQNQNQIVSPKVAGPSPLNQVQSVKKEKAGPARSRYAAAVPPPAPAPPAAAPAAFADKAPAEGSAAPNPHLIAAPGSAVRWLAGGAGLIEFSTDNGASWSVQTSGVAVDLLTGSAPSDRVCWMAGRAGVILLTVDGGAHWSTVLSPFKEDTGGIRASDALHATIWNPLHTKTFETSDGGITWKPVASQ